MSYSAEGTPNKYPKQGRQQRGWAQRRGRFSSEPPNVTNGVNTTTATTTTTTGAGSTSYFHYNNRTPYYRHGYRPVTGNREFSAGEVFLLLNSRDWMANNSAIKDKGATASGTESATDETTNAGNRDECYQYIAAGTAPVNSFPRSSTPGSPSESPLSPIPRYAGPIIADPDCAFVPSSDRRSFKKVFDRRVRLFSQSQNNFRYRNESNFNKNQSPQRNFDFGSGQRFGRPPPRQSDSSQRAALSPFGAVSAQLQQHLLNSHTQAALKFRSGAFPRMLSDLEVKSALDQGGSSSEVTDGGLQNHNMVYPNAVPNSLIGQPVHPQVSLNPEIVPMLVRIMELQTASGNASQKPNEDADSAGRSSSGWRNQTRSPCSPKTSTNRQNYSSVVTGGRNSSAERMPSERSKGSPVPYATKAALALKSKGENAQKVENSHKILLEPKHRSNGLAKTSPKGLSGDVKNTSTSSAPPPTIPTSKEDFEVSKMDLLSEAIWSFHNEVTQKDEMLQRKFALRDMLYSAITPIFPMCGLYVVGSSLNGFGNNTSDMDVCLMITNKDLDQRKDAIVVLNMIMYQLKRIPWVTNQQLIVAKVPILRLSFSAPYEDITVDLNANNSVAIKNTHLLCYYSSYDWRIRPLVSAVKEWARRKGINNPTRSSFTSYSLVLMVIHYLQCGLENPVLPSLQKLYSKSFLQTNDVRSLNISTSLPPLAQKDAFKPNTTHSLGELLIGFLNYYANVFDYDKDMISVREGKKIDRSQINNKRAVQSKPVSWCRQWRCVCIEEPFTYMNTAHSVYDESTFLLIRKSFTEALEIMKESHDLEKLFAVEPIDPKHLHPSGAVYDQHSMPSVATIAQGHFYNHHHHHHQQHGSSSYAHQQQRQAPSPACGSGSDTSLHTAHSSSSSTNGEDRDDSHQPAQQQQRRHSRQSPRHDGPPSNRHNCGGGRPNYDNGHSNGYHRYNSSNKARRRGQQAATMAQ